MPIETGDAVVKNKFKLYAGKKKIPEGTLGVVKATYPGGGVLVAFPSLGVEDLWTNDVFTEATREEAAKLREGRQKKPWWKPW